MERDRLLNICKWSYHSFDQACDQFGSDYCVYQKYEPLDFGSPYKLPEKYELKVGLNQFGFYSWLPFDKNDLAFIREHVVKPIPFTDIEDISEDSKFVCDFVERYTSQEGFLTGVSLTEQTEDNSKFTIFFAIYPRVPQASYFTFNVTHLDLMLCANDIEKAMYLGKIVDYCIWNVLGGNKI